MQDLEPADVTYIPMQVDTGIPEAALPGCSVGAQLLLTAVGGASLHIVKATPNGIQVGMGLHLRVKLGVTVAAWVTWGHAGGSLLFSQS